MAPLETVAAQGGGFDVVYEFTRNSTLQRMGFLLAEGSRERRVSDFAPAIRIGGDPGFSEGTFDQLILNAFNHGGDLETFEAEGMRYQYSDGGVALHREEEVRLASRWVETDTGWTATAREIVDVTDNNINFAFTCYGAKNATDSTDYKLRAYNGSVWSSYVSTDGFGGEIRSLWATDQYLFAAMGAAEAMWRWDPNADTWAQPIASWNANCFAMMADTMFSAYGNQLTGLTTHAAAATDFAVTVGDDSTEISDLYIIRGYLAIAKPEGLWLYDGSNLRQVIDARNNKQPNNFRGGGEFRGEGFVPWQNTIQKLAITSVSDVTVTDITPRMSQGDDDKIDYGHGFPIRAFGGPVTHIYFATDDGEGVYPEMIFYNGLGFHQAYRGTSGDDMLAAGYSPLNGWLLVNDGSDGSTKYKQLRTLSDAEFPNFAVSGQFTTPWLDAGFPDTFKSWREIVLEVRDCDANNTILIEYDADEAGFTTAETINGDDGKKYVILAGLDSVVPARKIRFRFTLTGNTEDVTQSPVIELPIVVRVLVTPKADHAFSDVLIVDEDAPLRNDQGVVSDAYDTDSMLAFIDQLEDIGGVIVRTDRYGRRWRVKNTDFSRNEQGQNPIDYEKEQPIIALTFLEAFNGLSVTRQVPITVSVSYSTDLHTMSDYQIIGSGRIALAVV